MSRHYSSPEEAFEARVKPNPTGCLEWTGAKIKDGYGMIKVGGVSTLAHRFSYERHVSAIPSDRKVLHTCDNPSCVNPDHLFLGTDQDNVDDMFAKGRGRKASGEAHGRTKLTETDVLAIKSDPRKYRDIATAFGIGKSTVGYIKSGKNWPHVRLP
jgi:hypothetical protein